GQTRRIALGTAVLILPYRPPLPTAKVLATLQTLSGERLIIGTGIGWMQAEFNAVGVRLRERARIADETLEFLRTCFANEVVESNGQPFLFKPRPKAPPFLVGGAAPHAIERALRLGDGWLPMGLNPQKLAPLAADYRRRAEALGLPRPRIATFIGPRDREEGRRYVREYADAGVTDLLVQGRYTDAAGQGALVEFAAGLLA
ncbi:MAG TPA: LLM class flavin-dependent oxidoreductase, partial [Pseudomonadales bacterium]